MPALGPRPRYEITHKRLKRHLKVHVVDHDEELEWGFKLTLVQWEALTRDTATLGQRSKDIPQAYHHHRVLGHGVEYATQQTLGAHELLRNLRFKYKAQSYWRAGHYVDVDGHYDVFTPLGLAVFGAVPVCPDRDEWPETSDDRRRKTAPPTKAQQRMLDDWPTGKCEAVPIGADGPQISRWSPVTKSLPRVSLDSMAAKGLLEVGVRGVTLEDGKLVLTGPPTIVYRPTVLGAHMGG